MNDDTKKIVYMVVAALAVVGAGFSIYKSMAPPKEVSIGSLPITKEGSPAGVQQPVGPGTHAATATPVGGDALSGAPADAESGGPPKSEGGGL